MDKSTNLIEHVMGFVACALVFCLILLTCYKIWFNKKDDDKKRSKQDILHHAMEEGRISVGKAVVNSPDQYHQGDRDASKDIL